jgi:hypothetical protein
VRARDSIDETPTGPKDAPTWVSGIAEATAQSVVERKEMEGSVVARSGEDGVGLAGTF